MRTHITQSSRSRIIQQSCNPSVVQQRGVLRRNFKIGPLVDVCQDFLNASLSSTKNVQ